MKTTIIKSKSVAITSALFLTLATLIGVHTTPSYADTPASSSSSANASVTVSNTINLTLTGGDLVIDNLTPGNASDSNIITATITSNSPYGYHLSATTGTSTGTTSLVNTADSNFSFTNLSTNKATLNDFSDNTWGYSYSTDNGTSWISGDYGTALSGYNGLTLDNDDSGATGTTLFNNDSYAGSTAVKFKIGAKSATTQAAGTYTGTVNFYAVTNPGPDNSIYGRVASLNKGKNTAENGFSWTEITIPTSTNHDEDTSSSGVYEWGGKNGTEIGVDSNGGDKPIYFYRGVLDTEPASAGSNGLADAYPNYVILSSAKNKNGLLDTDTCWRIYRTTSTGGVKMIYNGVWTGLTCANSGTDTAINTSSLLYNDYSASARIAPGMSEKTYYGLQGKNIHAIGYTYSNVPNGTYTPQTPAELFGASNNDTVTNANPSIMKQYLEDWYHWALMSYTNTLEGDAGYCQDRSLYESEDLSTLVPENSSTIIPYGSSNLTRYYFGAYLRTQSANSFNPILTCPRGKVDLYSYAGDMGNGNGQLLYPIALPTADEVSISGSGNYNNSFNAHHEKTFLIAQAYYWLLSPYGRFSGGDTSVFRINSSWLESYTVNYYLYVRPVITLKPGTEPVSGIGIATDPWVVNAR